MTILYAFIMALGIGGPMPPINTHSDNLALRGYDAVAYFTDGRALRGSADFETTWNGVRWRFASAAHRDAFVAAPENYAPQFGGYCAWAVAHNYTADGDPEAWKIVEGKLYVNYSKRVQRKWEADINSYIRQGQANWPAVLNK
jgi:YHS domain-containing protein